MKQYQARMRAPIRVDLWVIGILVVACMLCNPGYAQQWSGSVLVKLQAAGELRAQRTSARQPSTTVAAELVRQTALEVAAEFGLGTPAYFLYPKSVGALGTAVSSAPARDRNEERDRYIRVTPSTPDKLDELIRSLSADPRVVYAEKEQVVRAIGVPDDPEYGGQYAHAVTQAPLAWDVHTGTTSTVIAVIDTGVETDHPDLRDSLVPGVSFISESSTDENGHGTHCAGIAAAAGNNQQGIAGVSWASRVMPIRVLDESGSGTLGNVIAGIRYAADQGVSVINLSLGTSLGSQALQDAVDYALSKNVVVIAAAGNDGTDQRLYPAGCDGVIAVGATDRNDARTSWSNFGDWVTFFAPGDEILSTYLGGDYASLSGTSMAAPYVAGAAALLRSYRPELDVEEIKAALRQSTDDIGDQNKNQRDSVEQGRINLARLLGVLPKRYAGLRILGLKEIVGDQDGQATAGEQIALRISIRNASASPKTFRLVGSSQTNQFEFVRSEITVGPVPPGSTEEVQIGSSIVVRMSHDANPYGAAARVVLRLLEGEEELQRVDAQIPIGFPQIAGFPVTVPNAEGTGPVTIDDIDGDGDKEVIFPLIEFGFNTLWAVDHRGQPIETLKQMLPIPRDAGIIGRHIAVGNVAGDARKEIVVGLEKNLWGVDLSPAVINVFSSTGELLPGFPRELSSGQSEPSGDLSFSLGYGPTTPTLADVDGDGLLDIVVGEGLVTQSSWGWAPSQVLALAGDGSDLPGFPFEVADLISPSSPMLVDDLDGDGELEFASIVDGFAVHAWDRYGNTRLHQRVRPWSLLGDTVPLGITSFSLETGKRSLSSFGELGAIAVALGTGEALSIRSVAGLPESPDSWTPSGETQVPLWGDFDGDGLTEGVYVTPANVNEEGILLLNAIDSSGGVLSEFPIQLRNLPTNKVTGQMVAEDLDGDGAPEVVVPLAHGIEIRSLFGKRTFSATILYPPQSVVSGPLTPTIADIDNNGVPEVVLPFQTEAGDFQVHAFELPGARLGEERFWPMYQRDPQRSGKTGRRADSPTPEYTPEPEPEIEPEPELMPEPLPEWTPPPMLTPLGISPKRIALRLYQGKTIRHGRTPLRIRTSVKGTRSSSGGQVPRLRVTISCTRGLVESRRDVTVSIPGGSLTWMNRLAPKMKCRAEGKYRGRKLVSNVRELR